MFWNKRLKNKLVCKPQYSSYLTLAYPTLGDNWLFPCCALLVRTYILTWNSYIYLSLFFCLSCQFCFLIVVTECALIYLSLCVLRNIFELLLFKHCPVYNVFYFIEWSTMYKVFEQVVAEWLRRRTDGLWILGYLVFENAGLKTLIR